MHGCTGDARLAAVEYALHHLPEGELLPRRSGQGLAASLDQLPAMTLRNSVEFLTHSPGPAHPDGGEVLFAGTEAEVEPLAGLAHQAIASVEGLDPALAGIGQYQFHLRADAIPGTVTRGVALQPEGNPTGLRGRNSVLEKLEPRGGAV